MSPIRPIFIYLFSGFFNTITTKSNEMKSEGIKLIFKNTLIIRSIYTPNKKIIVLAITFLLIPLCSLLFTFILYPF